MANRKVRRCPYEAMSRSAVSAHPFAAQLHLLKSFSKSKKTFAEYIYRRVA
jgi:hypothetical protein